MEIIQVWRIITKRIWIIALLVILSVTVTAVTTIFFIKPQYEASTKLIVNKSSNGTIDKLDLSMINSNIQLIKTYKEIIKTPRIMDLVVQQYPELNKTSTELIKDISVNAVNDTQVMTVTARNKSYELAAREVNAVSKVFQNEIPSLMKVDNVSILNEAKLDVIPSPVSPKTDINIALSFIVSLMIGIGIVLLLEHFDDTVKSEQDITEFLDLPTLSVIPVIKPDDVRKKTASDAVAQNKVAGGAVNV